MPSRRRFLAAVGAVEAASFSGCSTRSYAAPTLAHHQLVFGTSGERVYSLDPETGEERWHRDVFGDVTTRVAVRPPSILVTTAAGGVYSLSLHGEGSWRRRLPDRIDCPPTAAADGQMYVTIRVGDGADALVALEQK